MVLQADKRAQALTAWARSTDQGSRIPAGAQLVPVSDDASFRRYFRFTQGARGLLFVDAPPEHEDNESFTRISAAMIAAGLGCPQVLAVDYDSGFMMITDLGDRVYLSEIRRDPSLVGPLYDDAVSAIIRMIGVECDLPPYDETRLREEMALFHEWFLPRQLGLTVDAGTRAMLQDVYDYLAGSALAQPTGFVHRDYHSRNLLVTDSNNPGIIDFQDAVTGPVTYDLVSLYKDCYYRFDRAVVELKVARFAGQLVGAGLVRAADPVLAWFDLMGAQRHLKCAGIFSRLNLRDGKPGYLGDIPLVIDYLLEVSTLYEPLNIFGEWLRRDIVPLLPARLEAGDA